MKLTKEEEIRIGKMIERAEACAEAADRGRECSNSESARNYAAAAESLFRSADLLMVLFTSDNYAGQTWKEK